jgi:hypothetical protein
MLKLETMICEYAGETEKKIAGSRLNNIDSCML